MCPPPRRISTPAGVIEFLDVGEGIPILYFHGTGAGADLVPPFEQPLISGRCRLIIPNRPGYYGTPLASRCTADGCAELLAALIDELGVDRVIVVGTSGGGPAALAFATRHPQRTAGLVLQCAQAHAWDHPRWLPEKHRWLYSLLRRRRLRPLLNTAHRALGRYSPGRAGSVITFYSGVRAPDLRGDPHASWLIDQLIASGKRCSQQPAGIDNDLEILFDPDSTVQPGTIDCPTLIIHDRTDPVVPFAHVDWIQQAIPHAEWTDHKLGGHLIWTGCDVKEMQMERLDFIKRAIAL